MASRTPDNVPPKRRRGRPPRDPNASEARQRLVRSGLIHLTERGYSSVGIDEILAHADVPKGGFYHYFSGKEQFGLALIEAYHAYFIEMLDSALADTSMSPLSRLKAFTRNAEAGMARHEFRRGCLIGNLGQEMAALPEVFRARLVEIFQDWQERTASCLRSARDSGEIDPRQAPDALAAFFWIGWEGAVLRAKLERHGQPLRLFADTFFNLVQAPKE